MADHSRRRRKCPPNAPHEALRPTPSSLHDGRRPPEQADTIFKGLRRCTPPQHPQHYFRLLGGSLPINLTRQNEAQCLVWGVTGAFPPSAAMVVTVIACRSTNHFFLLNLGIVGIARKLLSRAIRFLHCTEVEM